MSKSPIQIIDESPMSLPQVLVVAICILLNALDGFDVLSIAFAAPGIAEDWSINRAVLGVVLAMELIGMAVGAIILGSVADNFGRRPVILVCIVIMATGMYMAGMSQGVTELSIHRFYTGLAIGGMLATTNAMVAEFSNKKHRSLCVMLMAGGYPFGVIVGGTVATNLLTHDTWRAIFEFGSVVTISFLPFAWFLLPESVAFLSSKNRNNALLKINTVLQRLRKSAIDVLPEIKEKSKAHITELFKPQLRQATVVLTATYFLHIMTLYFLLKWTPKIVADMGYPGSTAGTVLVWANIGMLIGSIAMALLSTKFAIRKLMFVALSSSAVMIFFFGQGYTELTKLSAVAFGAGFFINAGVVGLYALFAQYYPDNLRASGTGFSIGLGRGGAASSPIIAGILFNQGFTLTSVATLMAFGSLMAAIALIFLPKHPSAVVDKT